MTDVWINYKTVVILPQAHAILLSEAGKLKCVFYFNIQSYCYKSYSYSKWARIALSAQWFTEDWMVWGSNAGGRGKIFWTCPDQTWGPTSLLYNE